MSAPDDLRGLSLLDRPQPPGFVLRVVTMEPRQTLPLEPWRWRDALVSVERGCVELTSRTGICLRFGRGDLLCLDRLPVASLRNPGDENTLLVALSRKPPHLHRQHDVPLPR